MGKKVWRHFRAKGTELPDKLRSQEFDGYQIVQIEVVDSEYDDACFQVIARITPGMEVECDDYEQQKEGAHND